ncbi:MAG: hypothetical protein IJ439_00800 [Tyzzerella sp.]|nr:hypothetical protein [Tyzzerella sp.]
MMKENDKLLPVILEGKIVHGKALGRTVGMPTANLCIENQKLPQAGVYATRIKIGGEAFNSVTNIGKRPTVDQDERITVETFIFDFNGDIYGETVSLEVCKFLRPVQKFQNLEEVHEQVKKDVLEAKIYFKTI